MAVWWKGCGTVAKEGHSLLQPWVADSLRGNRTIANLNVDPCRYVFRSPFIWHCYPHVSLHQDDLSTDFLLELLCHLCTCVFIFSVSVPRQTWSTVDTFNLGVPCPSCDHHVSRKKVELGSKVVLLNQYIELNSSPYPDPSVSVLESRKSRASSFEWRTN